MNFTYEIYPPYLESVSLFVMWDTGAVRRSFYHVLLSFSSNRFESNKI